MFRGRNYLAALTMLRLSTRPLEMMRRYVRSEGDYPWSAELRTPLGRVPLLLTHAHDVRTVNEVFFRRDYGGGKPGVVVDIGANIGISVVYFLTRSPSTRVYCWEPLPQNLATLERNVAPFADRVVISPHAVAPDAGTADFLMEEVGRYSGLAEYYEHSLDTVTIRVECDAIADALSRVVAAEGRIDVLKIDTEGSERALLEAIPRELWPAIGVVVVEDQGTVRRLAPGSSG